MELISQSTGLSVELRYLIYLSLWLSVLWIPYILAHIRQVGLIKALSYAEGEPGMPIWARRLKRAHYNLVENIVPFAVAVGGGEILDIHTATTATCALVFLVARMVHPFAQVAAIWGTRTLTFAVGWLAIIVYLLVLLGWL